MSNERLSKLREKQKAIAEQIKREESRLNTQKRKDDTRRKILVGAAILDKASRDEQYEVWLKNLLNGFLSKPDDRALFELPPLPKNDSPASETTIPPEKEEGR